ncbi:TraL conjugative transposon family protein [Phocaeicola dorei]|uniref:TraL conjugative transposon family protein n=1 Tax=Phocaeicola dorei TaxID=357276 RepID=UPI00319E8081
MKNIRKRMWGVFWKLHNRRKRIIGKLKGYLDGLPPKIRKRIVLSMLAVFAVLALYSFVKAVHDIGRNDGRKMRTGHAGRVELPVKPKNDPNITPYIYGTTED